MDRLFRACLLVCAGVVLGRMFDGAPVTASGGTGAGAPACTSKNGDVNGDGSINITDPLTILNHLFLSNPPVLRPFCAYPSTILDPGHTEGRFLDNGDGTITDNATGLMWQKSSTVPDYTFEQAAKYAADLELAGHDDWRLPNVRELESLLDYTGADDLIDPIFGTPNTEYWSTTYSRVSPYYKYVVNFHSWVDSRGQVREWILHAGISARAVRSAQ